MSSMERTARLQHIKNDVTSQYFVLNCLFFKKIYEPIVVESESLQPTFLPTEIIYYDKDSPF